MNFKIFLGAVMVLFTGILIFAYVVTKQANPVLLDDHGRPLDTTSSR